MELAYFDTYLNPTLARASSGPVRSLELVLDAERQKGWEWERRKRAKAKPRLPCAQAPQGGRGVWVAWRGR